MYETGAHIQVTSDRLIDVTEDDDVPSELREMVMRLVTSRAAAKKRTDGEDVSPEHAVWLKWPLHDYSRERQKYPPKRSGKDVAAEKAYAAYRLYWEQGLMQLRVMDKKMHYPSVGSWSDSYARKWPDISIDDILGLLDVARHNRNHYHELQLLPDVNQMA